MNTRRWVSGGLLTILCAIGATDAQAAQTRYSLVHGCFTLTGADGKAVPNASQVRMQPTTLGRYLLYRPDQSFVTAEGGSAKPAADPSPAGDWTVKPAGPARFTLSPQTAPDQTLRADGTLAPGSVTDSQLRFSVATGCANYPEAELDASGKPARGKLPYGTVSGLLEGHMHWMTYEFLGQRFHCGKPWDSYGIKYALPDCSSIEGPQGTAAAFQNTLNYGNPSQPHDTRGYPQLTSWSPNNLTYEGTYWRWIQRSWEAGLRLMVMGINENRILCMMQSNRTSNCNEMDTVRRGLKDVHDLQDYVDAMGGGPGKGFFQIVTNPYDARRVINQGKMAVVLEIEVSEPFDCAGWDSPTCTQAQVDTQFDEMYRDGVRSMLLLNKFDNPLTGVRFDEGPIGVVINNGNKASAGSYWDAKTCTQPLHDNTIYQPDGPTAAGIAALSSTLGLPATGGAAPAYPPAPHCNTRGLTDLGAHVVNRMMDDHMIVNPDHMSQAGVAATLSLLEARNYSGVISPHGWMDPGNWPRIWKLGGMAFPGHSVATQYVKDWQTYRPQSTPYKFGWGYGADLGGLSHQPDADTAGKLTYPFKGIDGKVTFERQKTGERTFDYTKDGVAHYGLYADWFADLARIGGPKLVKDMLAGSESYLEMWERADGIPTPACHAATGALAARGGGGLKLGTDWTTVLRRLGQPQQRGRAWSYCVGGRANTKAADVVDLTPQGKLQLIGTTAHGRTLGGVRVATKPGRRLRTARSAGAGVRYRVTKRGTYVWVVRNGRVRGVAIATRRLSRTHVLLRRAASRLLSAKATQVRPGFVPSAPTATAAATGRLRGRSLAETTDAATNKKLLFYCSLQLH